MELAADCAVHSARPASCRATAAQVALRGLPHQSRARRRGCRAAPAAGRRPASSATLAARTGCSLLGTMYLKIDSIQCASRAGGRRAGGGAGFCAERRISRRSKPSAATACSSRLARPRLSASGRRPWRMRQHHGQRADAAARASSAPAPAAARARRPQGALAVVEQARRIEQDHADVGARRAASRAGRRPGTTVRLHAAQARGDGLARQHLRGAEAPRADQPPQHLVAQHAGGAGDQQPRLRRAGGGRARAAACST